MNENKEIFGGSFELFNIIGKCLYFKGKIIKDPTTHIKGSFLMC
jgi:hypothetical protein